MITTESKATTFNFDFLIKEFNNSEEQLDHKLMQLYDKWKEERFTIGFTGHFSAGKSTLINALIKEELLPSSPIPTSANIVEVRYGEEETIFDLNDGRQAIEHEINLEHVNELAKNGEEVRSITVTKPIELLKNSVALMDTPGIDSSDDEEFKRTLANIHLIDYFVYVMDYNHVQSEVNFKFLRELQNNNIPFIIVVNQVDKHNENELLFDSFKKSLKDSCHSWTIEPKAVYYTSLINQNHPLNQLNDLEHFIQGQISNSKTLIENKMKLELDHLIEQWTQEKFTLNNYDYSELNDLRESNKRLIDEINTIKSDQELFLQNTTKELNKVLNNAYIMTFEARELAKSYLESLQPKFRVGKLFTQKKTEEERERRLEAFLSIIQERVKTEMVWHVRHLLTNQVKEFKLEENELINDLQQFTVKVTPQDLYQSVNLSAEVNGNSVLNYTNQLQKQLAQKVKQSVAPIINQMDDSVKSYYLSIINDLENQLMEIQNEIDQFNEVVNVEEKTEQYYQWLAEQTFENPSSNELIKKEYQEFNKNEAVHVQDLLVKSEDIQTRQDIQDASKKSVIDIDELVKHSEEILSYIKSIKPLQPFYQSLNRQLSKVNQSEMTIALFGAFSAGKSSFANAWVGGNVLPSSPNPTTAAINKICPVTQENAHEDVLVFYKTEDQMVDQLSRILSPFTSQSFTQLDDLIRFVRKNLERLTNQLSKTESSFVEAFIYGVEKSRNSLGKQVKITTNDFSKYVTVESISCFIEEIEVYYDCELTRQGVTLVDTPGADSIHARHTNTSFHYVKHSDAIIYVNYYNHAFSRADREFLIQLGRVKEAFALDKMFFILNASDLAKDEKELLLVKNYLNDQLMQYGIKKPSIYPLSSKQIMDGEESKEANRFFERFEQFIHSDSKELIASKLKDEQLRLKKFVGTTIEEAEQSTYLQNASINNMNSELDQFKHWVKEYDQNIFIKNINQEIDELTHYMKDRIYIQLNDLMKETINPATINLNGKKGREQLQVAIKKLLALLNQRLSNEFNATHILLDQRLTYSVKDWLSQVNNYITKQTHLSMLYNDVDSYHELEEDNDQVLLNSKEVDVLSQLYKNKKEFFEEQKVKDLYEELHSKTQDSISARINSMAQQLQIHYESEFNRVSTQLIDDYLVESNEIINQKQAIYKEPSILNEFKELNQMINS
ncbi:GTP-binding protein [Filobacillus milosensis]|uniref:GTP-binding protein n=1 Tax=Filobacillus milosensis TaxID=94137 RepID=A0A4Y8IR44_9BACI|nr:dynamin family protein [Filobacillus milosensis]TFB24026.1 GTP-binding protein [Filobacillus milosensis]